MMYKHSKLQTVDVELHFYFHVSCGPTFDMGKIMLKCYRFLLTLLIARQPKN